MKKLIALTGITALLVLTGCGQDSKDAEPAKAAAEQAEAKPEQATNSTEAKADDNVYSLTDENGTIYTLDLNPYEDENTKAADDAIAEAMAYEGDVDASELEDLTEWASLTIDNTDSTMESGLSYLDIQIVGDEMQYGIITDPSGYVAELTWMSEYGDQADADTYNRMLDIADAFETDDVLKPGVKDTYPIVLGEGLPDTIESVWCWDQEMK